MEDLFNEIYMYDPIEPFIDSTWNSSGILVDMQQVF